LELKLPEIRENYRSANHSDQQESRKSKYLNINRKLSPVKQLASPHSYNTARSTKRLNGPKKYLKQEHKIIELNREDEESLATTPMDVRFVDTQRRMNDSE
jgi:hypothetical protein